MRTAKRPMTLAILCACAAMVASLAAQQSGDLTVTATYKGKGVVDEKRDILVFLFDHPVPTAESQPLMVQSITKNGGSTTFKGAGSAPVYVVLVYNEKGDYDGRSGPPPAGTPLSTYGKAGKPVAVTPGAGVKVSHAFDDARRWK